MSLPSVTVSQSPESKFREYLASRPKAQRYTDQQRELVEHIFARHSHFDADQLIAKLKDSGRNVSRATVYRTLTKLVDAGLLRRIDVGPRTIYDHDYGYPAHDHLICEKCGTMIEFHSDEVDEVLKRVASEHHFQPSGRTLVVRGTCGECNQARAVRRRLVM